MYESDLISLNPMTAGEVSPGTSAHVVQINGRKFVTGLFWQPLSSPRNYMAEAREIGKKRNWDIVAIRRSLRIQAGFVSKDAGALKGMYSLAAALAGQLGPSWIGAFALEDDGQYAVVAVHDGSIVPGYDLVVGTREEALEALQSGYNLFQFDTESIYAPADFNFSPHERDIYDLLAPKNLKGEYRLRQLTFGLTRRELVVVVAMLLTGIGAIWGYSEYSAYEARKEREARIRAEQQRLAELERLNQQSKEEQSIQALAHPWVAMPAADDFVEGCIITVHALPLSVGGWMFEAATCESNGVTASYKRQVSGTTVKGFEDVASRYYPGEPVFADGGDTALVGRPLEVPFGGDDPLEPTTTLLTAFTAHFQAVDTKVTLSEQQVVPPAAPPLPGQVELPPPPVPAWRHFKFEYTADLTPGAYLGSLPQKNGVRVSQIKVKLDDVPSLTWTVSGDIYGSL